MLSIGELDLWKTQAVSGKVLDSQEGSSGDYRTPNGAPRNRAAHGEGG
jgi:hypothetical protein